MENRLGIRLRVGFVCPRRCISFGAGRMRRRNHAFVPTPLPLPGLPPRELSPRVPLRSTHGLRSGAAARLNGSSKEPSVLARLDCNQLVCDFTDTGHSEFEPDSFTALTREREPAAHADEPQPKRVHGVDLDGDPDEARTSVRASFRPSEISCHVRERFNYRDTTHLSAWPNECGSGV